MNIIQTHPKYTMSKQIFREKVPNDVLFALLEMICLKTNNYFLFDINAFKKMMFSKHHVGFIETLKPYYHLGKQFYLERDISYNMFTTLLRQICKHNAIMYTSQIKYNESNYNIQYMIYYQ